jgi:hypothetical protein
MIWCYCCKITNENSGHDGSWLSVKAFNDDCTGILNFVSGYSQLCEY